MKKHNIWIIAVGIGLANAVLLVSFEFVGVTVTNWLWNDALGTGANRWLVLPVAVILGLMFTGLAKLLKTPRVVPPESDLMSDISSAPATLPAIGIVLAIGAMSLLAGGSVGPEASLMIASAAIGMYTARKWPVGSDKQLLVLASIGALLVAFIDSIVLVLVPLIILLQQTKKEKKKLQLKPVAVIAAASAVSYLAVYLWDYIRAEGATQGIVPPLPNFALHDFVTAAALGFVAGLLALTLNWLIGAFWNFAKQLEGQKIPGMQWVAGALFGLVLGILYLLGGQTVEFSGSIGANLLASEAAKFSALALVGLVITKILATAWSKGTGYRGGLVFPTIYIGVALGLLVGQLAPGLGGPGAIIGGISGMMAAAVGSPVIAGIFLIAVLPIKLWPVAVCAIVGTVVFGRVASRMKQSSDK